MRSRSNAFSLIGILICLAAPTTAAENKAPDPVNTAPKSENAEKQLEIALQRQAKLENAGVRIWGVERLVTSYAEATRKLVDGDAHFRTGDFDRAAAAYQQAASHFEQLAASRPERLRRALMNGGAALEQLDDVGATYHFEIALAAKPGNTIADKGLRRANILARVLDQFAQAQRLETAGELDRALRGYREVEALDPTFQPSRVARLNIERRIAERGYRRAVSEASAALEKRDFSRSKDTLAAAKKLRPNAPEIREIATRIRAAMERHQLDQLDNFRRQAGVHERNEQWAASLRIYDDVLSIDAKAGFAARGKSRAERFLALNRELDHFLSQPKELRSSESLARARAAIRTVAAIENVGPRLSAKTQRLSALIAGANGPRPVILRSDQKTSVVIYRVARYGPFEERQLKLRPGTYTAIGSRPGYRDVWVRFSVRPSNDGIVVVVRCKERI